MAEEETVLSDVLAGDVGSKDDVDIDCISDIPVEISAVLGRCTMAVSRLLKLGRGAVVTLDRKVGEPIEILVNNRLVARGEVVIVENKIGITMTEIIRSEKD
jgi:flagellar motor switch protein FliN/FliY